LASPAVEAGVLRACYVLSRWEDIYRSGTLVTRCSRCTTRHLPTLEELRALAPEAAITSCTAAALTKSSGVLQQWRDAAGGRRRAAVGWPGR